MRLATRCTLLCGCSVALACHEPTELLPLSPFIVSVEFFDPAPPRDVSVAYAVSDDTILVGYSNSFTASSRATRWVPGQQPADVGGPGTPDSGAGTVAYAANASGIVVGYATDGYNPVPVRWNASGAVDTLQGLRPPLGGYAYAISDAGQAAGCDFVVAGRLTAVVWSTSGAAEVLDTLPQLSGSCAYGISGDGTFVVGDVDGRAFRWRRTDGLRDLGTLGGTYSRARAVTSKGQVVGESSDTSGRVRPFTWTPEGGMRALPLLSGGRYGAAYAINDSGGVVGFSENEIGERATLWKSGATIDLATQSAGGLSSPLYSHALAISPSGLIAGFQFNRNRQHNSAALWRVRVRD